MWEIIICMSNISTPNRVSQMYSLVEKWQNSSLRKKEFARRNNITVSALNYWSMKYANKNRTLEFTEIQTRAAIPELKADETIKFTFSGNVSAEVSSETALKFMHQLARI